MKKFFTLVWDLFEFFIDLFKEPPLDWEYD